MIWNLEKRVEKPFQLILGSIKRIVYVWYLEKMGTIQTAPLLTILKICENKNRVIIY